ncbi:UvrD-helicase domain-containing protein [Acaryochloris sp. CCMEE 5410]
MPYKWSGLVLAPAGTGKTSVLAARVDQAIRMGVHPHNCCA